MIQAAADGNLAAMKAAASCHHHNKGAGGGAGGSKGLHVKDKRGLTPLHATCATGQTKAFHWILSNGGEYQLKEKDNEGVSPLHLASATGHLDLVKWLVDNERADVEDRDAEGWTSLHWAASMGHADTFRWLVEQAYGDVSIQDKHGWTCLHYAAYKRVEEAPVWVARYFRRKTYRKLLEEVEGNPPKKSREVPTFEGVTDDFGIHRNKRKANRTTNFKQKKGASTGNLPELSQLSLTPGSEGETWTPEIVRQILKKNKELEEKNRSLRKRKKEWDRRRQSLERKLEQRSQREEEERDRRRREGKELRKRLEQLERSKKRLEEQLLRSVSGSNANEDEEGQRGEEEDELHSGLSSLSAEFSETEAVIATSPPFVIETEQQRHPSSSSKLIPSPSSSSGRKVTTNQQQQSQIASARRQRTMGDLIGENDLVPASYPPQATAATVSSSEHAVRTKPRSVSFAAAGCTSSPSQTSTSLSYPLLPSPVSIPGLHLSDGAQPLGASSTLNIKRHSTSMTDITDVARASSPSSSSRPPLRDLPPVLGSQRLRDSPKIMKRLAQVAVRVPGSSHAPSLDQNINDRDNSYSLSSPNQTQKNNSATELTTVGNETSSRPLSPPFMMEEDQVKDLLKLEIEQLQESLEKYKAQTTKLKAVNRSLRDRLDQLAESARSSFWEVKSAELELLEVIGTGNFGKVYKGMWRGCEVAVKRVGDASRPLDERQLSQFRQEAAIMKELRPHSFILQFLGFCAEADNACLVMEFLPLGNLLSYLRRLKQEENILSLDDLFVARLAMELSAGMSHLHSEGFLHRDLACRNILLKKDSFGVLHPVISDFGLSRHMEVYVPTVAYGPYKWMPPEFIDSERNVFEQGSDVWSFGVMLWEILMMGEDPFPGLAPQTAAIAVLRGKRLPLPENCAPWLALVLQSCWLELPEERPTFAALRLLFKDVVYALERGQAPMELILTESRLERYLTQAAS
ncbi:Tyrosine-protein kinase abl1 [Balamuthia mandrillaris]